MTPLELQLFTFLAFVLLGMAIGFLFDLLRLWRRLARPRPLTAHLGDAVFASVAGVLILSGLLLVNWLQLRAFVLLGLAAGCGLYLWLAAPWVERLVVRLLVVSVRAAWFVGRRASAAGRRAAAVAAPVWRRARRPLARLRSLRRRAQEGRRGLAAILRRLRGFLC